MTKKGVGEDLFRKIALKAVLTLMTIALFVSLFDPLYIHPASAGGSSEEHITGSSDVVGFTVAEYLPFDEHRLHKMLSGIKLFTE